MINGINHITFAVSNLEKSLTFYIDLLEMKLVGQWKKGAYLLAGGIWVALNVNENLKKSNFDYSHVAFNLSPTNYKKLKNKLIEKGIKEFQKNSSEGESFYFLDPDGHKLELHYNNLNDRIEWAKENLEDFF